MNFYRYIKRWTGASRLFGQTVIIDHSQSWLGQRPMRLYSIRCNRWSSLVWLLFSQHRFFTEAVSVEVTQTVKTLPWNYISVCLEIFVASYRITYPYCIRQLLLDVTYSWQSGVVLRLLFFFQRHLSQIKLALKVPCSFTIAQFPRFLLHALLRSVNGEFVS